MQNLMIIDNSFNYVQKIINSVSESISSLRVYNISKDINEALENINNKKVDIIIINVEITGLDIVKYIQENDINIYYKSIVLLFKSSKYIKENYKTIYDKYVFKCIRYTENIDLLIDHLRKLVIVRPAKGK